MSNPSNDFDDRNLYENEEAINKALSYLKYHDPANANRGYAIGLLKFMQKTAASIALKKDLGFDEFIDEYNNQL